MLRRLAEVLEDAENGLPTEGRALLRNLEEEFRHLDERVKLNADSFRWPNGRARCAGSDGVDAFPAASQCAMLARVVNGKREKGRPWKQG